jgi:hypothetical protein
MTLPKIEESLMKKIIVAIFKNLFHLKTELPNPKLANTTLNLISDFMI